jgi:hypothetical protein
MTDSMEKCLPGELNFEPGQIKRWMKKRKVSCEKKPRSALREKDDTAYQGDGGVGNRTQS